MAVILAFEQQDSAAKEEGLEKARERWRRWDARRKSNVCIRLPTLANGHQQLARADVRVEDKLLTLEIEPQDKKVSKEESSFEEFWVAYPNKVGKADARKSFSKAASRIDQGTLMAGLQRYVTKTDDRPWCNPATWLNQDRWTDQPQAVARGSPKTASDVLGQLSERIENAKLVQEPGGSDFVPPRQFPRLTQRPDDRGEGLFDGNRRSNGGGDFQDQ